MYEKTYAGFVVLYYILSAVSFVQRLPGSQHAHFLQQVSQGSAWFH